MQIRNVEGAIFVFLDRDDISDEVLSCEKFLAVRCPGWDCEKCPTKDVTLL